MYTLSQIFSISPLIFPLQLTKNYQHISLPLQHTLKQFEICLFKHGMLNKKNNQVFLGVETIFGRLFFLWSGYCSKSFQCFCIISIGDCTHQQHQETTGKLPTYPSLKPTLILTSHSRQNVGLGEGQVGSFPDTYNDPKRLNSLSNSMKNKFKIKF